MVVTAQGPLGWFCIWDEVEGQWRYWVWTVVYLSCHLDSFRKRQGVEAGMVLDHTPIPDPSRLACH